MTFLRFAIVALMVQSLPAQKPSPGLLQGTVVETNSLKPLPHVRLELRPSTGRVNSIVVDSGEDGKFTFPVVEPGQYRLSASKSGYVVAEYDQAFPEAPGKSIVVRGGQAPGDIRMMMTPGGVIAGRVLDRGKPVGNARVYAAKVAYELGHRVISMVLSAVTNDLGDYSIFWLPPGRYYIVANVSDGPSMTAPVTTSIGDKAPNIFMSPQIRYVFTRAISNVVSDTEMHVPMFHPGTTEFRDARPIDIAPGAVVRSVDVHADTVHALHVRGTVTGIPVGTNRQPAAVNMALFPRDGASLSPVTYTNAQPNGFFDFARVKPGTYILAARSGNLTTRIPIDVLDRDVNGVRIELRPSIAISGRVVIERQNPDSPPPVPTALRIALLIDPIVGGFKEDYFAHRPVDAAAPVENGTFTSPNSPTTLGYLPGDYQVVVAPLLSAPAGWTNPPALPANLMNTVVPPTLQNAYVKSIQLGDADILRNGLRLTLSDSPRDPLVITIGTNAGSIEGRVSSEKRQPAGTATVALIPEDSLRFRIAHKYAVTDAEGKFQIHGIAPGDYKLFAWEQVERGAWQDPEFISRHERSGKAVRIEEGRNATVELTAISR
jgi:hypothetical protein